MFTEVFDVPANVTESLMLVLLWLRLFSCFLSLDSSSDTGSESDGSAGYRYCNFNVSCWTSLSGYLY